MRTLTLLFALFMSSVAYADDHSGIGGAIAQIPSDSGGPTR